MNKKLKIITGASGYIGKGLTKELNKKKIKFVGIDKQPRKDKSTLKLDLKDKNNTLKFFNKFDYDEIFHFGTYSAVAYKKNFETCFMEDLVSLQNLIYSIKKNKKRPRLIYMSSSYVYSGLKINKSYGINEKKFLNPVHDFGFAKKFFEEYLTKYYSNSTIFRLSNVFGEGEFIRGNTVYNMAIEAKKNNKVTIWGRGNRKIQYIYIRDLMKYLISKKKLNGIFNLGGKEYVKISTLTKKLCNFFGSEVLFLKDKEEGETLSFMNTNKIRFKMKNYFTDFEKNLVNYLKTF
jgi:nucleoside-diphosphate-sugar epimerase